MPESNAMTKAQVISRFKAGFTIGDNEWADEILVDKDGTTGTELRLWAYDANLCQSNFWHWADDYRRQVALTILRDRRFKHTNLTVYLDCKPLLDVLQNLYEFPLPGMKTNRNQQQYVSYHDGAVFVSRHLNNVQQVFSDVEAHALLPEWTWQFVQKVDVKTLVGQ